MNPKIIEVRNVNTALAEGLNWLARAGTVTPSRNGPVLRAPGPVLTAYSRPAERVMFSPLRDANPFFHLYECIWMLAGRNDAASVGFYAKTMESFADADGTLNGAYGARWRSHFGYDQLKFLVEELKADCNTRRCVLSMWDPANHDDRFFIGGGDPHEARAGSKDVPCNTHVYFDASGGALDMTVCNRSNDIVWGAYGANAVHMSFLHEVIAACTGLPLGTYYQFSNNFHTYVERPDVARLIYPNPGYVVKYAAEDRYAHGIVPYLLRNVELDSFLLDCEVHAEVPNEVERDAHPFFKEVFVPMMCAHKEYKYGDLAGALYAVRRCRAQDWRTAGEEWLMRREAARVAKARTGGAA